MTCQTFGRRSARTLVYLLGSRIAVNRIDVPEDGIKRPLRSATTPGGITKYASQLFPGP